MIITKNPTVFRPALGALRHNIDVAPSICGVARYFMPRSFVVVDHGDWTHIRQSLRRGTVMQSLDTLPHIVASTINKLGAQLATSNNFVITVVPKEALPKLTFDVFHRVLYQWDPDSVSNSPEATPLLGAALDVSEVMAERLLVPFSFLWSLPLARNRTADAACGILRRKVENLVGARRAYLRSLDNLSRPTLLDFMTAAHDNVELTEDEVLDNIMGFFIAWADLKVVCAYVIASYDLSRPADGPSIKYDSTPSLGLEEGNGTMHWRRLESLKAAPHVIVHNFVYKHKAKYTSQNS
ncbi:hypothetical protein ACHHYP_15200 [Achlya hypogyna]|uniref:Cytochrome P450 n=1 Tax=Achlya hypogyna TaxID=1202772 RepID=A0A1V9YBE2_ACHHY|nr:hypothetical protein ACHHYP_15200 [Achlya hypogyna]